MFKNKLYWKVLIAILWMALLVPTGGLQAQQASGNGMRISPTRYELSIQPGSSKTFDISITNISAAPLSAEAVVNNFMVEDESASPLINLDPDFNPPYGLTDYLTGLEDLNLDPGEEMTLSLKITMPADAAPGSYYGLVRFTAMQGEGDQQTTVALSASVGTLLLVTVPGDIVESMSLLSLSAATDSGRVTPFFSNAPTKVVVRLENTGNVFLKPFGKVTVKNWSGETVYEYELNNTDPRGNVLPQTIRRFEDSIQGVGSFGRFTIEANISYGEGGGQIISATSSFWVLPWPWILAGILAIVALYFLIRKGIPAYNRRVISKARR